MWHSTRSLAELVLLRKYVGEEMRLACLNLARLLSSELQEHGNVTHWLPAPSADSAEHTVVHNSGFLTEW